MDFPKLYGIDKGQRFFKVACIEEFARHLKIDTLSAYKNWRWGKDIKKFPDYLPSVLKLVDRQYSALEILGGLPKYTIDYELILKQHQEKSDKK